MWIKGVKGKFGQENGPKAEKHKTAKATKIGRRTREEIQKSGIKLTVLKFHTGGDIRISGLPSAGERASAVIC